MASGSSKTWIASILAVLFIAAIVGVGGWMRASSRHKQRQEITSGGTVELARVMHGQHLRYDPMPWWDRLRPYLPNHVNTMLPAATHASAVEVHKEGASLVPVLLFRSAPVLTDRATYKFSDDRGWSYLCRDAITAGSSSGIFLAAPAAPLFPHGSRNLKLQVFSMFDAKQQPQAEFRFINPAYRAAAAEEPTSPTVLSVTSGSLQFTLDEFALIQSAASNEAKLKLSVTRNGSATDEWRPRKLQVGDRYGGRMDMNFVHGTFSAADQFATIEFESGQGKHALQYDTQRQAAMITVESGVYKGEGPFSLRVGFEKSHGFLSRELHTIARTLRADGAPKEQSFTLKLPSGSISVGPVFAEESEGWMGSHSFPPTLQFPPGFTRESRELFQQRMVSPPEDVYTHVFKCEGNGVPDDFCARVYDVRNAAGEKLEWIQDQELGMHRDNQSTYRFKNRGQPLHRSQTNSADAGTTINVTLAITALRWVDFVAEPGASGWM